MNPMLLAALLGQGPAHAAGAHAGIPVAQAVAGQGAPSFQTPEIGWTAPLPGGALLRVYVGVDDAAAADWMGRMLQSVQVTQPALDGLGDEARGDGDRIAAARDGNVGVMVVAVTGAADLARQALAAISDDRSSWPAAATLRADGDQWLVSAPGAAHVQANGGRMARGADLRFTSPPHEVVVWDAYGRATATRFEAGAPIETDSETDAGPGGGTELDR